MSKAKILALTEAEMSSSGNTTSGISAQQYWGGLSNAIINATPGVTSTVAYSESADPISAVVCRLSALIDLFNALTVCEGVSEQNRPACNQIALDVYDAAIIICNNTA